MTRDLSPQQVNPLGGVTSRIFSAIAAVLAVVIGVGMTVFAGGEISAPVYNVAALVAITISACSLVYASSAFRAPFGRRDHLVVCLFAFTAVILGFVAQWTTNELVRDDWAPISIAVLTIALAFYRPAWEMVVSSVVGSLVIFTVVLVQPSHDRSDVPHAVFALLTAVPLLAAGLAAAAYSHSMVSGLLAWRAADDDLGLAGGGEDVTEPNPGPSRSRHLVHLDDAVLPFLASVAAAGVVTAADGARARTLAREMTSLMVLDSERSWVTGLVRRIDDPDRAAEWMTPVERGFVRAVVAHAETDAAFSLAGGRLSFLADGGGAVCSIVIPVVPGSAPRVRIAPYVAVAKSVFESVDCQFTPEAVVLSLGYAARPSAARSNGAPGSSRG